MMDSIYELYTGDYIDLSNLVVVEHIREDGWITAGRARGIKGYNGWLYFECKFRFVKDSVKFIDDRRVSGELEIEKRKVFIEAERQKLINAWKEYKGK